MILELRGFGALDGPVARVVHARRHFVGQQLAIFQEQFEREHTHVIQGFGDLARVIDRPGGQQGRQRRRRETGRQDPVDMPVLGQRPGAELAVAAAYRDDGNLALEGHESFEDQADGRRLAAERRPGGVRVSAAAIARLDSELALAVVAETPRLQDARQSEIGDGAVEILARGDVGERRHGNAELPEQGFFRQPVLRDAERARVGENRNAFGQPLRALGRDVLEIEGGDIDAAGEFGQHRLVAIITHDHRHELAGAGIDGGIEHEEAQAQRRTGKREHAGELPAAEDADGGHSRLAHSCLGSGLPSTSCVCVSRKACNAARISG